MNLVCKIMNLVPFYFIDYSFIYLSHTIFRVLPCKKKITFFLLSVKENLMIIVFNLLVSHLHLQSKMDEKGYG